MTDLDLLIALDAALAEPVHVLQLAVAPGLVLELVYDDEGALSASWQGAWWWRLAEIGEA